MRIKYLASMITHRSPDKASFSAFTLFVSEDQISTTRDQAGVDITLITITVHAMVDLVPVNNRLHVVMYISILVT